MSKLTLPIRFTSTTIISRLPSHLRNPTTLSMTVSLALPCRRFQTFAGSIAHLNTRPFCVPSATGTDSDYFSDLPGDELDDFEAATVATGPLTTGPGGSEPDWDASDLTAAATGLTSPGWFSKPDVTPATVRVTSPPDPDPDPGWDDIEERMQKLEKRQELIDTQISLTRGDKRQESPVEEYEARVRRLMTPVEEFEPHIRKVLGDDVDEDFKAKVRAKLIANDRLRVESFLEMEGNSLSEIPVKDDELKTPPLDSVAVSDRSLRDAGKVISTVIRKFGVIRTIFLIIDLLF